MRQPRMITLVAADKAISAVRGIVIVVGGMWPAVRDMAAGYARRAKMPRGARPKVTATRR